MKITRLLFCVKEAAELLTKALGWVGSLQQNVQRVYYLIRMGKLQAYKFRLPHKSARCPSLRVYLPSQLLSTSSARC